MLFQTVEFFTLFLLLIPLNALLRGVYRQYMLLIASYFFYAWFNLPLVGLILFSTGVDFAVGSALFKTENLLKRRLLLVCSLVTNLGLLAFFKYFNFFIGFVNGLSQYLTNSDPLPYWNIILPLGISFYTFQTLSYTIDVYRGVITEPPKFGTFALYVSFFPQLVAGPIVRARDLIPQLERGPKFSEEDVVKGIGLLTLGLLKKVVIADNLAKVSDTVFTHPEIYSGGTVLLGIYAFAFQIYADFSGYSNMARGIAQILGYRFPVNFTQPYFAIGIRDFWQRWHITLSTWLRDYLYIPLGGNRSGAIKLCRNVMVTMLLGGLWHGAQWTFVFWGALHGLWIISERYFSSNSLTAERSQNKLLRFLLMLLTFHGVCLTWVFFRAESFSSALNLLSSLATSGISIEWSIAASCAIPLMIGIDTLSVTLNTEHWFQEKPIIAWTGVWSAFIVICLFGVTGSNDFIYFQFE